MIKKVNQLNNKIQIKYLKQKNKIFPKIIKAVCITKEENFTNQH